MEKQCHDISQLYPGLSPEQLVEAEQTLDIYVETTLQLYERILHDPVAHQRLRTMIDNAPSGTNPSRQASDSDQPHY